MIYTAHIQKFLFLSAFFFLPIIAITIVLVGLSFLKASESISTSLANVGLGFGAVISFFITSFCGYLISGTITWIVAQSLAVPLRPIKLRSALVEARKKWKTFAGLGTLSTLLCFAVAILAAVLGFAIPFVIMGLLIGFSGAAGIVGAVFAVISGVLGFVFTSVWLMLTASVVMMENQRGLKALKRSKALVSRSLATSFSAYVIMFLMPLIAAATLSFFINTTAKAFQGPPTAVQRTETVQGTADVPAAPEVKEGNGEDDYNITFRSGRRINLAENKKDMRERLKDTFLETLLQILLLPIQIVVISFSSIIISLLYLKTRQAGGEPLQDLLANFEETDKPRKKWQERVRQRLIQSGRITSRS